MLRYYSTVLKGLIGLLFLLIPFLPLTLLGGCTKGEEDNFIRSLTGRPSWQEELDLQIRDYGNKQTEKRLKELETLGPNTPFVRHECIGQNGLIYYGVQVNPTQSELETWWDWYGDRPLKVGRFRNTGGLECRIIDFRNFVRPDEYPQWRVKQKQQAMQGRSNTCASFGFKENTDAHSQCMFDLFKLEQSAAQSRALQSQLSSQSEQISSDAALQRALLQQQIDQQEFNQSIELMQQGLDMVDPPRPNINCDLLDLNDTISSIRCR